jgi:hypothetical protein
MVTRVILLALVLFSPTPIWAQAANERSATYDLAGGQRIIMDLSAGGYEIVGWPDAKVRVQWSSDDAEVVERVKVRFTTERGQVKLETDHTNKAKVLIQVPARSDLRVRLSAGELNISGIEGHKDVGLSAGELNVHVGDPEAYRDVRSSVRIGQINAEPFHISKGGFFRGFNSTGQGNYLLRATVGVGEVNLSR